MDFTEAIKMITDYIGSNGRTDKEIAEAEKKLGVIFARDYHDYLKEIGLACFDGHELTGLTKTIRLDVVFVTKEQRRQSDDIPSSWYVIEEAHIDGIVIWQDSDGTVYQTGFNSKGIKIASSLAEYIFR